MRCKGMRCPESKFAAAASARERRGRSSIGRVREPERFPERDGKMPDLVALSIAIGIVARAESALLWVARAMQRAA